MLYVSSKIYSSTVSNLQHLKVLAKLIILKYLTNVSALILKFLYKISKSDQHSIEFNLCIKMFTSTFKFIYYLVDSFRGGKHTKSKTIE